MEMVKECRRLFKIQIGQYIYSTYFVQSWCNCETWRDLHQTCKSLAKNNLDRVPEYQILSPVPTATQKIVTVVHARQTQRAAAFASAVIFSADGQGECLHLGLSVVDSEHRKNGISTALNFFNVLGFAVDRRRASFLLTNVTTSAAILHAVGKYLSGPYPFFGTEAPGEKTLCVARAFAGGMRVEARLREDARFCDRTFVFLEGNKGNEFCRPEGGDPVSDNRVQGYYKNHVNDTRGDVMLQVGRVSPYSLLSGGVFQRFKKLFKMNMIERSNLQ